MTTQHAETEIIRNPNPLVLPLSTMVMEAARRMDSQHVSVVLVTEGKDNTELAGIFTGRDAISRVLAPGRDPAVTNLGEVMTNGPVVITSDRSALEALHMMQEAHCRHLPIVDNGKIVGVYSRGDFRAEGQGAST